MNTLNVSSEWRHVTRSVHATVVLQMCVKSQTQLHNIKRGDCETIVYSSPVMVVIVSVAVPRGDSHRPKVTVAV